MTSQLCGSILAALNHRKNLLDSQTSLNEQISILEKITSPKAVFDEDSNAEESSAKKLKPPRPIALVPPRILNCEEKQINVVTHAEKSPRRPRGRPKKFPLKPNTGEDEVEKCKFIIIIVVVVVVMIVVVAVVGFIVMLLLLLLLLMLLLLMLLLLLM